MISERQWLIFKNVIAPQVTLQVYEDLCVIRTSMMDGEESQVYISSSPYY